ncbi:MAG: hypothetical protein ACJ731_06075 [Vicinamibacterales bacterium]
MSIAELINNMACAVVPSAAGLWTPTVAPSTRVQNSISAATSRQIKRGMIGDAPAGIPDLMVIVSLKVRTAGL